MGIGEESHVGATEESCVGVGEESGMGAGQLSDDQYFLGNQCLPVDVVMSQTNQGWFGFKIVENKNVILDTKVLMFIHVLCIISMHLPPLTVLICHHSLRIPPDTDPRNFDLESVLPLIENLSVLKRNFCVIIARIITTFAMFAAT